ncbi:MAG: YeeE/YedE thiosulfate transporter family protein [Polyangiales bacterium]
MSVWTRRAWSPYAAGAALGVVATISMAAFHKPLSGSGAWMQIGGYLGRAVAPDNLFFDRVVGRGFTYEIALLVGMFLGALASALASGSFAVRMVPDIGWRGSVLERWLVVFFGTALIELAAGIAGGCTASLAISGGGAMAPGAFVFMAGMFAGGIPVAWWVSR